MSAKLKSFLWLVALLSTCLLAACATQEAAPPPKTSTAEPEAKAPPQGARAEERPSEAKESPRAAPAKARAKSASDARIDAVVARMAAWNKAGKTADEVRAEMIASAKLVKFIDVVNDLAAYEGKAVKFDATWIGDPSATSHFDDLGMTSATMFELAPPNQRAPSLLLAVSDKRYRSGRDIAGWEKWKDAQVRVTALIVGEPLDREALANGRLLVVEASGGTRARTPEIELPAGVRDLSEAGQANNTGHFAGRFQGILMEEEDGEGLLVALDSLKKPGQEKGLVVLMPAKMVKRLEDSGSMGMLARDKPMVQVLLKPTGAGKPPMIVKILKLTAETR